MSRLDKIEKRLDNSSVTKKSDKTLMLFFLGILLLGIGIFMVFQATRVEASWHIWYLGSWGMPTGLVAVPLLIGIGVLFYNKRSAIGWIVIILGIAFILITIIMSVNIRFKSTSLYVYILMFGSIMAGGGLILRALFRKR